MQLIGIFGGRRDNSSGENTSIDYNDVAERFDPSLAAFAKLLDDIRIEWPVSGLQELRNSE